VILQGPDAVRVAESDDKDADEEGGPEDEAQFIRSYRVLK
jgi:hypothetical protein